MKTSDWLVMKKLEEIEKLLVAHHVEVNERFDRVEKLIVREQGAYVSPKLERAVKLVTLRSISIDRKVSDEDSE